MKNYPAIIRYHVQKYFFEKFAWPQVRYDKIAKVVLKRYLPKNPIMIDCGAHDGSDSTELARILKGEVHSFEPVEKLYRKLQLNAKNFPNISCYEIALSNQNGSQEFYVSEGNSDVSSSLLAPKEHINDHPTTFFREKIVVQTLTLDRWAELNNITRVDLLWLDMQGFELKMLEVSNTILDTVSVIHTEVSTKETYSGVTQYLEYRAFLEKKGFKAVIEAIPAGWDMGNVLFIKQ